MQKALKQLPIASRKVSHGWTSALILPMKGDFVL